MENSNLNNQVENATTLKSIETLENLSKHFGYECFVDYTDPDYDYIEGTCYAIFYKDQNDDGYDGYVEFTNYWECNGVVMEEDLLNRTEDIFNNTTDRVYFDENKEKMYLFDSNKFTETDLCECYDQFGQLIGCEGAGCNSFENSYSRTYIENPVSEDDFDTYEEYQTALKNQFEEQIGTEHDTIEAYNYWNGNNWRTLYCNQISKFGQEKYSGLTMNDEDKEMAIILKAWDEAQESGKGFGFTEYIGEYAGKKYKFITTQFASDPFIAEVEKIED